MDDRHTDYQCFYGFPSGKCLEMGCGNYYENLRRLTDIASRLASQEMEKPAEEAGIWESLLGLVRQELNIFDTLFPEGPVFFHDEGGEAEVTRPGYQLTLCVWCRKPIEIGSVDLGETKKISWGICSDCRTGFLERTRRADPVMASGKM